MSTSISEEAQYAASLTKRELQALLWQMRADLEQLIAEIGPARMDQPGAMGEWTYKDMVAHLTDWRWWSVERLEGALQNEEPSPPWGGEWSEDADIDRINQQFYEAARGKSLAEVLSDSRATLDRLESALLAIPDADLTTINRYPWLPNYPAAAIITGSVGHLREHAEQARLALRT